MVRSDSADESFGCDRSKTSNNEEDDEPSWSHSNRSASSSCNVGGSEAPNVESVSEISDRRIRRQIANCNERRRMQSINAGFQCLRSLLPKGDGEKLSKAAILQHTAELIQNLKAEKLKLMEEKETVINARKRKMQDVEVQERGLIDGLMTALEQERRLRQLYEQRLLDLRVISPLLSQFVPISQTNHPIVEQPHPTLNSVNINGFVQNLPLDKFLSGATQNNAFGNAQSSCGNTSSICSSVPSTNPVFDLSIMSRQAATMSAGLLAQQHSAILVNAMQNESAVSLSHRNLNAILEAIRQLESGTACGSNVAEQQPNVLVR